MFAHSLARVSSLTQLRIKWFGLAAASLALLVGISIALQNAWGRTDALRWLAIASVITVYLFTTFWRALEANRHPEGQSLSPDLGWANLITLARGLLLAALAGFLFAVRPPGWLAWVPAGLYLIASLADYLDGYLARTSGHVTVLGEILDLSLDGLGVLIASMVAYYYGQVPLWFLAVGAARYIYLIVLRWRRHHGLPGYELPSSDNRRALAGVQMGFISVILLPVFKPPGTHLAASLFMIPFLGGFLRDGWIMSQGRDPLQILIPVWFYRFYRTILPVGLRLLFVALMGSALLAKALPVRAFPYEAGTQWLIFGLIEFILILGLGLGIAGRLSALGALILSGFYQNMAGLSHAQNAIIVVSTGLLFLGTGPLSLWKPEDKLLFRRLG